MKNISYQRIYQSREYLAPLGKIRFRAHFGGYSLSIDNTVFTMISEGELYLRACEESAQYRVTRSSPLLTIQKRGRAVSLNYYFVDEHLWRDLPTLLRLSSQSLAAAREEKAARDTPHRLKDLPNISFQLEMMLFDAGIPDERMLRHLGAKACWLRLKALNKHMVIKVLLGLEGAIIGLHEAALPALRRQELIDWYHEVGQKKNQDH
ncbi:competence protein [Enterobacteriaceae bacterium ENNIH3]|nr:competence protein [Enterobacteriaceae bacterium ENNIH3]AUV09701.1 competence protein [Enterobacteriaceae bacterium ENNIH2]